SVPRWCDPNPGEIMSVRLEQPVSFAAAPAIPPPDADRSWGRWARRLLTVAILLTPLAALSLILSRTVDDAYAWRNMALAVAFYVIAGHGVTVGFHRLFTHRSFEANRPLKIALAVLGSMAL